VRLLLNEENSRTKPMREVFNYLENFANFFSQQPNIGMFVPAVFEDGEWRVLEEPKPIHTYGLEPLDYEYNDDEVLQYKTAIDNVIFEGFYNDFNTTQIFGIKSQLYQLWFYKQGITTINSQEVKTIEDLTKYNLTLTSKFAKEFGLI
jgi:hypothetical protein